MWCTRWFLPLLLLPIPSASPYFLVLFLFSLTLHAKPCFYCVVLLSTLFVSSCYWQPFPLDSPLSAPSNANLSTFADALRASLPQNYSHPLPTVIRAVDRCWCDFSAGNFFDPFNVSNWEHASVQRLRAELLSPATDASERTEAEATASPSHPDPAGAVQSSTASADSSAQPWYSRSRLRKTLSLRGFVSSLSTSVEDAFTQSSSAHATTQDGSREGAPADEPSLRGHEYDLRHYGLELILDLGWS